MFSRNKSLLGHSVTSGVSPKFIIYKGAMLCVGVWVCARACVHMYACVYIGVHRCVIFMCAYVCANITKNEVMILKKSGRTMGGVGGEERAVEIM